MTKTTTSGVSLRAVGMSDVGWTGFETLEFSRNEGEAFRVLSLTIDALCLPAEQCLAQMAHGFNAFASLAITPGGEAMLRMTWIVTRGIVLPVDLTLWLDDADDRELMAALADCEEISLHTPVLGGIGGFELPAELRRRLKIALAAQSNDQQSMPEPLMVFPHTFGSAGQSA